MNPEITKPAIGATAAKAHFVREADLGPARSERPLFAHGTVRLNLVEASRLYL